MISHFKLIVLAGCRLRLRSSTLLHLIGAIERPGSGTIISNGQNVTALHGGVLASYRRTVGFVFQSYHLLPALTPWPVHLMLFHDHGTD